MKLPSLQYLSTTAIQSFKRFPFSIVCSFIGTVLAVFLVEEERNTDLDTLFWVNLMLVSALGIPFYFCVSILKEKLGWNVKKHGIAIVVVTLFLGLIYWSLPNSETTFNPRIAYIRYFVFNVVAHLLVSFLPYYSGSKLNGFWNYNKVLFIRIVTAFLYSGVLSLGIIIALLVIQTLFSVDFDEKLYFEIALIFVGFFNTWFFVSGIPKNLESLEEVYTYPKGLKVFVQYVLLPLLIMYLIILYAYGTKITLLWNWPKGIISYLISGVSILGIFTFLLMYPYGKQKENAWISKFSKAYYFVIIPLIVLLFIAIFMRLEDYGITVNRYVIVLLGIWLSFLSIYFCFGKKNIKVIPISLAILMLLASFGPWSMFAVGERTQVKRLKQILQDANILVDGKVVNEPVWNVSTTAFMEVDKEHTNSKLISDSLYGEVRSIVHYLDDYHNLEKVNQWTSTNIDSLIALDKKEHNYTNVSAAYMKSLGLETYRNEYNRKRKIISYRKKNYRDETRVSGFDYLIPVNHYYYRNDKVYTQKFVLDSISYALQIEKSIMPRVLVLKNKDSIHFDVYGFQQSLEKKYSNSADNVVTNNQDLELYDKSKKHKILFDTIEFKQEDDTLKINNFSGKLLMKSTTSSD